MMHSAAALAVTADAERTVAIAAAIDCLDRARHMLDGRHEKCLLCNSELMPVAHVCDEGEYVESMFVHETGCPLDGIESLAAELRARA